MEQNSSKFDLKKLLASENRTLPALIFVLLFLLITSYLRGDLKMRIPTGLNKLYVNPAVDMHEENAPETQDFMKDLQADVKKNWHPPAKAVKSNRVNVLFEVNRTGKVNSARVSLSSKDPDYDKAALDAVYNTKIRALPDILPDEVNIEMSFDYNVWKDKKLLK